MKVFLLFMLWSFLAWSISKLSSVYESRTDFAIQYKNIPDSLLSRGNGKKTISAKIKASGFQFLGYAIYPKVITLDLENVFERDGDYFLTTESVETQLDNQLPNRISLVGLPSPLLHTDLYLVGSKIVPIIPNMDLRLEQNHALWGGLKVKPDSVQIKGPKKDIHKIKRVYTLPYELSDISTDFSKTLGLQPIDSLGKVIMEVQEATVSGKVVRFSEKEFDIAIKARNVPIGYRIRMFPDHVQLVCKAEINTLKGLADSDFDVFVDYNPKIKGKHLFVELAEEPNDVFSVRLLQNRVEFVLEKLNPF